MIVCAKIRFFSLGIVLLLLNPCVLGVGSKYFDLSYTIEENMSKWPTSRALEMNVTQGVKDNGIWYQTELVKMETHLGTHLDAPCHFVKDAWCVNDIPFHYLVGRPTVVVDIRDKVFSGDKLVGPDAELLPEDLTKWESQHGQIPDGSVVLVRSGYSRYYKDDKMYRGTEEQNPANHSFPGVAPSAATWLTTSRRIMGVGIDTLSIDYGKGDGQSHEIFGKSNIYVLENISPVLDELPEVGVILTVGLMKFGGGASGAPASLVAFLPAVGNISELVDEYVPLPSGSTSPHITGHNSSRSVMAVLQLVLLAVLASLAWF